MLYKCPILFSFNHVMSTGPNTDIVLDIPRITCPTISQRWDDAMRGAHEETDKENAIPAMPA